MSSTFEKHWAPYVPTPSLASINVLQWLHTSVQQTYCHQNATNLTLWVGYVPASHMTRCCIMFYHTYLSLCLHGKICVHFEISRNRIRYVPIMSDEDIATVTVGFYFSAWLGKVDSRASRKWQKSYHHCETYPTKSKISRELRYWPKGANEVNIYSLFSLALYFSNAVCHKIYYFCVSGVLLHSMRLQLNRSITALFQAIRSPQ